MSPHTPYGVDCEINTSLEGNTVKYNFKFPLFKMIINKQQSGFPELFKTVFDFQSKLFFFQTTSHLFIVQCTVLRSTELSGYLMCFWWYWWTWTFLHTKLNFCTAMKENLLTMWFRNSVMTLYYEAFFTKKWNKWLFADILTYFTRTFTSWKVFFFVVFR